MAAPEADALNENQRRHFLSSCQYVDRLLTEMEAILASSESGSPSADLQMLCSLADRSRELPGRTVRHG
jgi:hypothetical protein